MTFGHYHLNDTTHELKSNLIAPRQSLYQQNLVKIEFQQSHPKTNYCWHNRDESVS